MIDVETIFDSDTTSVSTKNRLNRIRTREHRYISSNCTLRNGELMCQVLASVMPSAA